jgi:hypothetical protein
MIDVLKLIGAGDLMSCSNLSGPKVISGVYSNSKEWCLILKDYNGLVYFYRIDEDKWYCRSNDSSQLKPVDNVVFFKRMDLPTVRDMKLNEILS